MNLGKENSWVIPGFNVGFGHEGRWTIDGEIDYYYKGHQKYYYRDSGMILPIFDIYWGFKSRLPFISAFKFTATVRMNDGEVLVEHIDSKETVKNIKDAKMKANVFQ